MESPKRNAYRLEEWNDGVMEYKIAVAHVPHSPPVPTGTVGRGRAHFEMGRRPPVVHAGVQRWFGAAERLETQELPGLMEDRGLLMY
jgi:hypothetical protein